MRRLPLATIAKGLLLAAIAIAVGWFAGLRSDPVSLIAISFAVVVTTEVVRSSVGSWRPFSRNGDDERGVAEADFHRWQVTQVSWALDSQEHFRTVLRPILVELAEDLLIRHHRIDWRKRPADAQRLLGDGLYGVITGEENAGLPDAAALGRMIARLEAL